MSFIKKPRFTFAKNTARKFVNDLDIKYCPVDPINIIYEMNWEFEVDDLHGEEGYTFRNPKNNKYQINIDNSYRTKRQRCKFTIAHEIGHIILKHYENYNLYALADEQIKILDVEANIAAGEILMPYKFIKSKNTDNVYDLSLYFDVSIEAIDTRLKFLGIRNQYILDKNINPNHYYACYK